MKMRWKYKALLGQIFGLMVVFTTSIQAQEVLSMGRSYRSLAMGNTGVASAIDSAALLYNPAILANAQGWWFDYAAWTVEASEGFTLLDVAPMLASPSSPYINRNGISDDKKETFLSYENPYLRTNAGMYLSMNLTKSGFSVAGSYLLESIITTTDNGANIYQRDDTIQKIGASIPLGVGTFVLGVCRNAIERRVASDPTADSIPNWGSRYAGTGYDIGLLYRMANQARITWGLVAQNYGGLNFEDSGIEEPQSIALGFSMIHDLGLFNFILAADVREISSEKERKNTFHTGVEIGMFPNDTGGSYLTYRVGYNHGYVTQGVEVNIFNHSTIIGYTIYGEEVGEYPDKVESRRTIAYLSMGF